MKMDGYYKTLGKMAALPDEEMPLLQMAFLLGRFDTPALAETYARLHFKELELKAHELLRGRPADELSAEELLRIELPGEGRQQPGQVQRFGNDLSGHIGRGGVLLPGLRGLRRQRFFRGEHQRLRQRKFNRLILIGFPVEGHVTCHQNHNQSDDKTQSPPSFQIGP